MSVAKREGSTYYWCHFVIGGTRIRESTGTTNKEAAKLYEAKRKAELWEQQRFGTKEKRPWPTAVVRWLREKGHKKSIKDDKWNFNWLDPFLGNLCLHEIDEEVIAFLVEKRFADGVTNATVNRLLALVRAILRLAQREWKWIDRTPVFPKFSEPSARVRWLKPEEVSRLLPELPPHKRNMSEFSLETGLRAKNVARLTWPQVDMARRCAWVIAEDSKSKKAIGIPLSDRAMEILEAQRGKHPVFVFTYTRGKKGIPQPILGNLSTKAWYKALKRAGISNFRWHDQRHTWASWHVQDGTPTAVIQELGSWTDIRMLKKYAHLNTEHLRPWVDRDTNVTQQRKKRG